MIARTWRGWVRTEQAALYVEYITRTGLSAYGTTPGNLGAQMWTTDLGDGRTEVMTVSWWSSRTTSSFMSTAVAPILWFPLASTVAFGPPGRTREHPGRLPWSRPVCRAPFTDPTDLFVTHRG